MADLPRPTSTNSYVLLLVATTGQDSYVIGLRSYVRS